MKQPHMIALSLDNRPSVEIKCCDYHHTRYKMPDLLFDVVDWRILARLQGDARVRPRLASIACARWSRAV
jgi:hypothetical protein